MPGIIMCNNEKCAWRFRCYRYMAPPSMRQAFAEFHPDEGRRKCSAWIPILRNLDSATRKGEGE